MCLRPTPPLHTPTRGLEVLADPTSVLTHPSTPPGRLDSPVGSSLGLLRSLPRDGPALHRSSPPSSLPDRPRSCSLARESWRPTRAHRTTRWVFGGPGRTSWRRRATCPGTSCGSWTRWSTPLDPVTGHPGTSRTSGVWGGSGHRERGPGETCFDPVGSKGWDSEHPGVVTGRRAWTLSPPPLASPDPGTKPGPGGPHGNDGTWSQS